jgi:hypothetical protein
MFNDNDVMVAWIVCPTLVIITGMIVDLISKGL